MVSKETQRIEALQMIRNGLMALPKGERRVEIERILQEITLEEGNGITEVSGLFF